MAFDPNAPLPDFASQQEALSRQQLMAQALRKQAMSSQAPSGQVIGNQFVAPHWTQLLAPILDKLNASTAESQVAQAHKDYGQQVNEAQQNWQSSLPQSVAAQPGRPELQGPPAAGGSPELAPVAPTAAQIPSRSSVLSATLRGMKIPGNEQAAGLWNKGMQEEQTREDNQAAKKDDRDLQRQLSRDNLVATLAQRAEDAKLRSEDMKLSIDQRAQAAKEMAHWHSMHEQTLLALGQLKADTASGKTKPIPQFVHKNMNELDTTAKNISELNGSFKPEFAGLSGAVKTAAGAYIPGVNTEATEWWKNYRKMAQLTERHAMFGSALTASEKGAWRGADIEPTMNPAIIAKNLAKREDLAKKLYSRTRDQYIKGGYNIDEAFPELDAAPAPGASPALPPGLVLPPGAKYIGPAS